MHTNHESWPFFFSLQLDLDLLQRLKMSRGGSSQRINWGFRSTQPKDSYHTNASAGATETEDWDAEIDSAPSASFFINDGFQPQTSHSQPANESYDAWSDNWTNNPSSNGKTDFGHGRNVSAPKRENTWNNEYHEYIPLEWSLMYFPAQVPSRGSVEGFASWR